MKVFLTGGTGFIGKSLSERLQSDSCEVYEYSRGECLSCVEDFNPDMIIHSAAEIYDSNLMFDSNLKLTYDLLEEASKLNNLKSFLYTGSSSEYGYKTYPMEERDVLEPRTLYEATKGCGTLLCKAFHEQKKVPTKVFRLFSVYGPHEPLHRLIPTIYDAYKTKKVLNIVDGSHDFIHIDDVMDCMLNVDVKDGDVINVGTGISTSNIEVVNTFENIVQKELEYNQVQKLSDFYSERDNMEWSCDTDYAENEYQFVPKISFKKGLEKYINYREGINE